MTLTYTEKKRPRASFGRRQQIMATPYLLQMQIEQYNSFLQKDVKRGDRESVGLQKSFADLFPIESNNGHVQMNFHGYDLEEPLFTVRECKERNLSYSAKIKVDLSLRIRDRNDHTKTKEIREETGVYMGDLPLMTPNGSFVINGTERVVVSQLHRSPSVYFMRDTSRLAIASNKTNFQARVIPLAGSWLDLEFDSKDLMYFRIDKRRKINITLLLRALGYSVADIVKEFYDAESFELGAAGAKGKAAQASFHLVPEHLFGVILPFEIRDAAGKVVVEANTRIKKSDLRKLERAKATSTPVPDSFITDEQRRAWDDVVDPESGEVILNINETVTSAKLEACREAGIKQLRTIYHNDNDCVLHISNSIQAQLADREVDSTDKAREEIFRHLRPGEPASPEMVARTFNDTFFNPDRFDLSKVGRMKINQRLGHGVEVRPTRMLDHVHTPRPALEWCVTGTCSPKKRDMPKPDALRSVLPADQLSDEDVNRLHAEIKDVGPRVVASHLTREQADELAGKLKKIGLEECQVREMFVLSRQDILNTVKMLINLVNGKGTSDDIDSLGNRRIRMVGEFIKHEYESGLRRFHKAIVDRMQQAESENMKPSDLVNARTISQGVREFFNSNQLSQFMDQNNLLAEITHKRRVSALGVGGLQRDRAGFEVRDVHPTHYGRLCPIETPEGPNIGLINSLALYSRTNEYGFLTTPYQVVSNGKVTSDVKWLSAVEEANALIAQANSELTPAGKLADELVTCRRSGEFTVAAPEDIDYIDIAPSQIASVAAALIPFLEHDDANRALMGSNMQRQALPSIRPQKPLVGTGLEAKVAADSGQVVRASRAGVIDYVDASRIVVRASEHSRDDFGVDIYNLTKYMRSNQNTTINQRPIVSQGDKVEAGDVIADGAGTDYGEMALGQNVMVAFVPWFGYNFEDSILVSEKVVTDDRFTTVHIEEFVCKARDTRNGKESITRDIPNQTEAAMSYLDEAGIILTGTEVSPGDILVGKVTPKTDRQPTPEERLLKAIFGSKGDDVKDTSLRMPGGTTGTVIDVKVFTADAKDRDVRAKSIISEELAAYRKDLDDKLKIYREDADNERGRIAVGQKLAKGIAGKIKTGEGITKAWWGKTDIDTHEQISLKDEQAQSALEALNKRIKRKQKELDGDYDRQAKKLNRNDELQTGVNKNVKVYVAIKRKLQVGDKMAGRHGNKGVVSKIVPVEDMPYLVDGTPVDIVLNPLGVPSRMNIGQILETHLGLAASTLGDQIAATLASERKKAVKELRAMLPKIYARKKMARPVDFADFSDEQLIDSARNLTGGVPFATPIFDGAGEDDIKEMLKLSGRPESGQMQLYDGRSGEPFARPSTIGHKYMFKLHHLVDEKMHARSIGTYSLVTQQPLGGKAQDGGQRFGEMEVWALEAYGAAYTLWEMLTVKSDDRVGRNKIYESICKGDVTLEPSIPESYKVLKSELRALAIDFEEE